jgi:MoaA/NifB/PqqE/SkfB family radical SAM enzyme
MSLASLIKFTKNRKLDLPMFKQSEMPLPRHLLLAATFKCTARCPHCYMLQQNTSVFGEQDIMTENLFQQIMNSPFIKNIRKIKFCGGEALLNPSVFNWMDQAEQRGITEIATITNGLSLQDDQIVENLLKQDNVDNFHISLDSTTKEGYCRAKGIKKCDFGKILMQVRRIADRFRGTQTSVSGSFVTTSFNTEEVHRIITFGESIGLHKLNLHAYHEATGNPQSQSQAKSNKVIATYNQIMERTDYQIDVMIRIPFGAATKTFFCPSLASYLCIGANGFLAPCCHMPWDAKYGQFDKIDEGNPINHPLIIALREQFMRAASENESDRLPASCRFCPKRTRGKLSFIAKKRKWALKNKNKKSNNYL